MALQGTLKDFGLADIFQLIGIQRTTGVLTLENEEDTVVIKFLDGQVVGADTRSESLESRLGAVLVRTGRITQTQLDDALAQQRSSLQRLGHILVSSSRISEEELIEALRIQSSEIIYRLFRWRTGAYRFTKLEDLEYDRGHFTPISSETILMEGARMIDEWPIIERKIRSATTVLRRTAAAPRVDAVQERGLDADLDLGFGLDLAPVGGPGAGASHPEPMRLSAEERQVLSLIDGKRGVREICDLVALGEFETYRILADLLTRSVIEEVGGATRSPVAVSSNWAGRVLPWLALAALGALAVLGTATIGANPLTPWSLLAREATTEQLRLYSSMARLEKLGAALDVYYLDTGTLPESVAALVEAGQVQAADPIDPWGRAYAYTFSPGGYSLAGLDGQGRPRAELTVSRRLSAAQHLLVGGSAAGSP